MSAGARTTLALQPISWEYETVNVNRRGEIVARTSHRAEGCMQVLAGAVILELVAIPAGRFLMGSPESQGYPDEHPAHSVSIPGFLLGRAPVTQAQWSAVMRRPPPYRSPGAQLPADRISWDMARDFCAALARTTTRPYRLPSEAEWEYACRAGSTTSFHFGPTLTTDLANYVGDHTFAEEPAGVYRHVSTPAETFPPNEFGLYDMHGNVWEWCQDAWHDDYRGAPADGSAWEQKGTRERVARGGSWHETPGNCRSAVRLRALASEGEDFVGFRVALAWDTMDRS
jgi:formylglycine-generating enzyme required for sulfatase activity